MGHLNVRFWMRRFYDSLVIFAHDLGFDNIYNVDAKNTLIMRQAHVKFIKEAHVGAPLYLMGAPSFCDQNGLSYYAEIRHSKTDDLAATLNANLDFVKSGNGEKQDLPQTVQKAANSKTIIVPKHGAPRSIELTKNMHIGNLDWAVGKGFKRIGLMPVRQSHCDCFGRLLPEMFFGLISESVPNISAHRHTEDHEKSEPLPATRSNIGAAVLENRFDYYELPQAGDIIDIYSGIVEIGDKTRTIQHRLFNAKTKSMVCLSHVIVANFDLDARKSVSIAPELRTQMEKNLIIL